MATKRIASESEGGSSSSCSGSQLKRRAVSVATVEKWITDYDKAFNTATWLNYEKADRSRVSCLKCSVCERFVDKLRGYRNFSLAFIEGSANLRTSSLKDHARSTMHEVAMRLLKKAQSASVFEYAPIARALSGLEKGTEEKVRKLFDIAYFIAVEGLAFSKMKPLCELQQRHGVNLGETYRNEQACATFIEFIAKDFRSQLTKALHDAKFFSIQMDGSTDSGNMEQEMFMAIFFDPHGDDGVVHIRSKYLCVKQPKSVDASGLFECLQDAMSCIGMDCETSKLIGFGCDGASVNMGERGLRGLLCSSRPWLITIWCLSHRLELSLKDALKQTLFTNIDEFLMQIYYVYSKAPKKCRELEEVTSELKSLLDVPDFPAGHGNKPKRACGTRFVCHKVQALQRILDRFGAYMNHLITLSESPSTKPSDKQKLIGYLRKWRNSRILLGCAAFHDILQPVSILCKCLQSEQLCIVNAIEAILRTNTALRSLKSTELTVFPSVKKVLYRIKEDQNGGTSNKIYQNVEITNFDQTLDFLRNNYQGFIDSILYCLRDRLKTRIGSDTETLSDALKILATHGWEKVADASFGHEAIQNLQLRFAVPLQKADVNSALLQQEWDDMVWYAKQYINLVQDPYSVVWWKLFNSCDAKKWNNILTLVELTFTIPLSNAHVERCFSQLKLTKTNRRTSLGEDHLDHLLQIRIEGPPLEQWDATTCGEMPPHNQEEYHLSLLFYLYDRTIIYYITHIITNPLLSRRAL